MTRLTQNCFAGCFGVCDEERLVGPRSAACEQDGQPDARQGHDQVACGRAGCSWAAQAGSVAASGACRSAQVSVVVRKLRTPTAPGAVTGTRCPGPIAARSLIL